MIGNFETGDSVLVHLPDPSSVVHVRSFGNTDVLMLVEGVNDYPDLLLDQASAAAVITGSFDPLTQFGFF